MSETFFHIHTVLTGDVRDGLVTSATTPILDKLIRKLVKFTILQHESTHSIEPGSNIASRVAIQYCIVQLFY